MTDVELQLKDVQDQINRLTEQLHVEKTARLNMHKKMAEHKDNLDAAMDVNIHLLTAEQLEIYANGLYGIMGDTIGNIVKLRLSL